MKKTIIILGMAISGNIALQAQAPFDATFNANSHFVYGGNGGVSKVLPVTNESYLAGYNFYGPNLTRGYLNLVENDVLGSASSTNYCVSNNFFYSIQEYAGMTFDGSKVLALGLARDVQNNIPYRIFLERHVSLQNSALDSSFGTNGLVEISPAGFDTYPDEVIVQQDQKIVVGGRGDESSTNYRPWLVVRMNNDGSLDNSFGISGIAYNSFFGTTSSAVLKDLKVLGNGKYLMAGTESDGTPASPGILARLNANGSIDSTFGTNGYVRFDIGPNGSVAQSISVAGDGSIFVAVDAYTTVPAPWYSAGQLNVIKLTADGNIDSTFATNGVYVIPIIEGPVNSEGTKIEVLPNGKIIVAGRLRLNVNADYYPFVMQLTSAGALDPVFGGYGIEWWDYASGAVQDFCYQTNGKLTYVYGRNTSSVFDATIGRLIMDPNAVSMDAPATVAMEMYPNPAAQSVNVSLSSEELVSLFSIDGRLLLQSASAFNHNIDLSGFAQGVYVVRAGNAVQRLVKE